MKNSTYKPDHWEILKISFGDDSEILYKVAGGWSGSYLYGQSWKVSSVIVSHSELENEITFKCYSGSEYICRKTSFGLHWYTESVVQNLSDQMSKKYPNGSITRMTIEEYEADLNNKHQ